MPIGGNFLLWIVARVKIFLPAILKADEAWYSADDDEDPQTWDIDPYEDCFAKAWNLAVRWGDRRILKLNPNYPLVHFHLGQAYERKDHKGSGAD